MIFIDETGANTRMARLRGWAPRGERCRAAIPHGHWKTTTFTCGLRLNGIAAPMLLDGPMNGATFKAYVEQVLVPDLNPGDIVVMDNLPAHKVAGIRQAIEAAGVTLLYLPPYTTARTSTPSRWPSQNSRLSSERPQPEQRTTFGTPSHPQSKPSPPPSVKTISLPQDMIRNNLNPL